MSDDHVERPVAGEDGGYCAKCDSILPIKYFKHLLTYAETKARGHTGNHRLEVVSLLCRDCRPKKKRVPLSRMNRKQIHNAVEAGDLSLFKAEHLLNRMEMGTRMGRSRGAYSRWAKARRKRWAPLVYQLNQDMATLHQQEKYARTKGKAEMHAYAVRYKEILTMVRFRMRKDCENLELNPPEDWRTNVIPRELEEIKALWAAIPNRHRLTVPALLNPRYVPPVEKEKPMKSRKSKLTPEELAARNARAVESERIMRARMDFMDEMRAKKEAERAARIAQGEDIPPLPERPDRPPLQIPQLRRRVDPAVQAELDAELEAIINRTYKE